jgi:hypothetical protein
MSVMPSWTAALREISGQHLYAGQPISALITISTTFHWGIGGEGKTYRMRFDIEEMVREWLVSGRKRGDFVAKVRASLYRLI